MHTSSPRAQDEDIVEDPLNVIGHDDGNFRVPKSITKPPGPDIIKWQKSTGTKEGRLVGFYTQRERKQKIRKFKVKIQRWKKKNKYRRVLIGRSQVARLKARLDGKFRTADCKDPTVSQTGFTNGIFSDYEVIRRNKELELFQADKDFNKIVDFAVL